MTRSKFTEDLIYSQFFSFEVLNYFDSIVMEENFKWIEKYFNVLMKDENINAEKYNMHHIRPCCTFKDDEHKNRKQTLPSADVFNGNLIKLSIYNHLFAHFYLWKIFNTQDTKKAFQRMCGQGKYIDNLTEQELQEIAILKEECAKKNQTEEEKKIKDKIYRKENKDEIKFKQKLYKIENKDKIKKYNDEYNKSDKRKKVSKKYHETHKNEDSYKERQKSYKQEKGKIRRQELNKRRYYDPKTENYYSRRNMVRRIKEFPQIYENMTINDFRCISVEDDEYKNWKNKKKELSENREYYLESRKKENNRLCFDPIDKKIYKYSQLEYKMRKDKNKYKNIKLKDCIIK